jgi:DNA helicase-2/ATP-dependent DNA helicase PcrA
VWRGVDGGVARPVGKRQTSGARQTPRMASHTSVAARLERLAPDQRAAATAPPGPLLCIAPAGSGKTTTLVARIAWLIDEGVDPATIAAITFNARAAEELRTRLVQAVAPLGIEAGTIRVRTFHALGREILVDAGVSVDPLVDRLTILRRVAPAVGAAGWRQLDDAISRLKLDLAVTAEHVAADPAAGPVARTFVAYEKAVAATGGLDFDDLVVRSLRLLETSSSVLERWRDRCAHLLVDEVQDVDRSQLRLALLLAAPANRIFLVGDDDQSIYGWRLADVRRVLALDDRLPGLGRVDLVTNYRCPGPVVERAVRLVEQNRERFAKTVAARAGATGRLVLAPDAADDVVRVRRLIDSWPADGGTRAILARTNRELLPTLAVALERGIPFNAPGLATPLEDPRLPGLLDAAAAVREPPGIPLLVRLGRLREVVPRGPVDKTGSTEGDAAFSLGELVDALIGWAPAYPDLVTFAAAVRAGAARLAELRRDDAPFSLATAHGTKGLEFDHVAVIGLEEGRFPRARSIADSADPERALEEERRLAYVAWTRARCSLTLSYDPAVASPFLREAFSAAELAMNETGTGVGAAGPGLSPHGGRVGRGP